MAKNKNNTTLYVVLAIAAVFLFNNGFTGNYISNYHSTSDPSRTGCPQEGQWRCELDQNGLWWTSTCVDGSWMNVESCGTHQKFGTNGCKYKRLSYGETITQCESPNIPQPGSLNYRPTIYQ